MITNYAVFPGALSSKFCDLICEIAYTYPEQGATITGDKLVNKSVRSSRLRWIDEFKHTELNTIFHSYVHTANRDRLGFDISYGSGSYQYTEYHAEEGGHYGWHIDCLYNNNAILDRKVSLCVHLSDPSEYEGGVFCMDTCVTPKFDVKDFTPRGSILIFPSYIKHCVTPVTRGIRKSLVAWYGGPRFR